MLIRSYGLFWRAEEVLWNPGKGNAKAFRLLGREGKNKGTLRLADFRAQQGIYILYGNTGAHYAGLTRQQGFGKRLQDHLTDEHEGKWTSFSWFGFRAVNSVKKDEQGLHTLRKMPAGTYTRPNELIKDVEALLIKAMSLRNTAQMNFTNATCWEHVKLHEVKHYMSKIG